MELLVLASFAGVLVGLLSGLLGIGGGVVMVPLLRLGFGMSPINATATSLFTIIPTSIAGTIKHSKAGTSVVRVGLVCGIAGACMSPVGVLAAAHSPGILVMICSALVMAYSSFTMFKKAASAPKRNAGTTELAPTAEDNARLKAYESCNPKHAVMADKGSYKLCFTPRLMMRCLGVGAIAGFMSGYVGVGGGFIMIPLFISLLGIPMRLASGTSLVAVCILAIPGTLVQASLGNISYIAGCALAMGSIPGALIGASLVKKVPERTLRFAFACFLVLVAVLLVVNEVIKGA